MDNSESHEATSAASPASDFSGAGSTPEVAEARDDVDKKGDSGEAVTNADASPGSEDASVPEDVKASDGKTNGSCDKESTGTDESLSDPLTEAMNSLARVEEQLARRNADMYNLEQEYKGYVRRSKAEATNIREAGVSAVVEALLPVLDDVELARQHGDLQGPFLAIAEKLESSLKTAFAVERFGEVGDTFDPQKHEALMHTTSADVVSEQIGTLIQPGYRMGERILRPARVGVVSPE